MQYRNLGNSDLKVSRICLGTMTFGEQNNEQEAFEQLDYAWQQGVNFLDTAEMYSVPTKKKTYGSTEKIIGNWMQERKNRDKVIVATKVCGPTIPYIRGGSNLTKKQILQAIDGSLKRLQTDYVDLYQLHWPNRATNIFSRLDFTAPENENSVEILESLAALNELVQSGKVRHIGVSNETPWGVSKFLKLCEEQNLAKIVSIQNPYSLLNRVYEIGSAEFSWREGIDLLPYSPLAFGVLSGKYLHGKKPPKARLTIFPEFRRYTKGNGIKATEDYFKLAQKYKLDPSAMALAFAHSRFFVGSTIIGATTMDQLKININSIDLKLSPELLAEIEAIHSNNPNPAP